MISRRSLWWSKESHVISAEVFEEVDSDLELSVCLLVTLGTCSLNGFDEEVPDLFVLHWLNYLSANFSEHQVPLFVLKRIVESRLRTRLQRIDEWLGFIDLSVGLSQHDLACQGVNDFFTDICGFPFSINKVIPLRMRSEILRVYSRKGFQNIRERSLLIFVRNIGISTNLRCGWYLVKTNSSFGIIPNAIFALLIDLCIILIFSIS